MTDAVHAFLEAPIERVRTRALRALWHAAHEDWEAAHQEAQEGDNADCAWVHALLHREEGDDANARYWYARAKTPVSRNSVQQEREEMIATLLSSPDRSE